MNRTEDEAVGRADRNRSKATSTARTAKVREMARAVVNCAVMEMPEADRAVFMHEAASHLATLYTASQGAAATGSLYGKLSKTPIDGLSRAIASARAEQACSRLTRADNDDEGAGE